MTKRNSNKNCNFQKINQHAAGKNNSKLTPIARKWKILTNSNHLSDNDAKMLGAGIAFKKNPQHLIINPGVS